MTTINLYHNNVSYHINETDIVLTSLEALLQRATNANNTKVDYLGIEAFCALINKEKDGPIIATKLIATRIHSRNENEVLQTLHLLDFCMRKCGAVFHAEIGKFRFLNEMIKLVSPKYLGAQTQYTIKQRVIQLLYIWTLDYPTEKKMKDAYDMLKRQGVVKCAPHVPAPVSDAERKGNSVLHDEEKNKLLQKLLQSKNPEDVQAANRLIKNMVREDERRVEVKVRKITELEHAHNNAKLLNEMLDSYKVGFSSDDELDLINELHQSCERLRPNMFKLAVDTTDSEEILNEIVNVNDELGQVFLKYTSVIMRGKLKQKQDETKKTLLDFNSPNIGSETPVPSNGSMTKETKSNNVDLLSDVFPANDATEPAGILQPQTPFPLELIGNQEHEKKQAAFDDLTALNEQLLENLGSKKPNQYPSFGGKVPMNVLAKQSHEGESEKTSDASGSINYRLYYLTNHEQQDPIAATSTDDAADSGDDVLVDITEDVDRMTLNCTEVDCDKCGCNDCHSEGGAKYADLKLSDFVVRVEDVQPSEIEPITLVKDRKGVTVSLHFADNKPDPDVNIVVVTVVNKNKLGLTNFQFQAVVSEDSEINMQPPSGNGLPPYNSFLPPLAITQILLISNPLKVRVSLKYMVSFTIKNETITEMGEVDSLPLII